MKLWIVGKVIRYGWWWEFQGVFDEKEKAETACRNVDYFVAPVELNERLPDEMMPWPGAYYPKPI